MRMRRRGPEWCAVAATTAVVAGTAGAVSHHQQQKHATGRGARSAGGAAARGPAAAPTEPDYMAELQQLAQLRDSGVITAADFEAKKQQILGI